MALPMLWWWWGFDDGVVSKQMQLVASSYGRLEFEPSSVVFEFVSFDMRFVVFRRELSFEVLLLRRENKALYDTIYF